MGTRIWGLKYCVTSDFVLEHICDWGAMSMTMMKLAELILESLKKILNQKCSIKYLVIAYRLRRALLIFNMSNSIVVLA